MSECDAYDSSVQHSEFVGADCCVECQFDRRSSGDFEPIVGSESTQKKEGGKKSYTFAQVCAHLLELNNFSSVWELCSGLQGSAVRRLTETWERLPEES